MVIISLLNHKAGHPPSILHKRVEKTRSNSLLKVLMLSVKWVHLTMSLPPVDFPWDKTIISCFSYPTRSHKCASAVTCLKWAVSCLLPQHPSLSLRWVFDCPYNQLSKWQQLISTLKHRVVDLRKYRCKCRWAKRTKVKFLTKISHSITSLPFPLTWVRILL